MSRFAPLYRFAVRHPWPATVLACLVVVAVAPGMARLELRTDGRALVPPDSKVLAYDRAVRETFGIRDPLVVFVHTSHPNGIYNAATLRLVRDLAGDLARLDGVRAGDVISLATEKSDRYRPGTLEMRGFLDPFPESETDLQRVRDDVRAIRLYQGTLVSFDEKAAAIFVGVPAEGDRTHWWSAVRQVVAAHDPGTDAVHVIGAPVAESLLGHHILADLGIHTGVIEDGGARHETSDSSTSAAAWWRRVGDRFGLVPLVLLVMAIVFFVSYRSLSSVVLPLVEVGACLAFVFGLMGWFGVPVYLTLAVTPVLLAAMGVTDEIHIFAHHLRRRRANPGEPRATSVEATLDGIAGSVVKTSLTTALGFFSFTLSPLVPLRAFGLFTGIGILFCMLWSLTVIPALLVLFGPAPQRARRANARPQPGSSRLERFLERLVVGVASRRPLVLAALGVALLVIPLGIRRIVVQDGWIDAFAPESELYRATQLFDSQFFGTHVLLAVAETDSVVLRGTVSAADIGDFALWLPASATTDTTVLVGAHLDLRRPGTTGRENPKPGDRLRWNLWSSWIERVEGDGNRIVLITPPRAGSARFFLGPESTATFEYEIRAQPFVDPPTLREIERFGEFVRSQRALTVGGVLGPADYIETTEFIVRRRDPRARSIPDEPERVSWLWQQYSRIRGSHELRHAVDPEFRRAVITIYLGSANYVATAQLLDAIRSYEREHLAPAGIHLEFAGDVAVSQSFIEAIVSGQVRSLAGSLLGVLLVAALLLRSLRWALACMVPCALGVATCFASMGWFGIPLGVATSMFASVILGVGVDYAIHFVDRYRALGAGTNRRAALATAARVVGPPVLVDALAVALGFGVLMSSHVPANARLGMLSVVCIVTALLLTFLVLPALLPDPETVRIPRTGRRDPEDSPGLDPGSQY